MKGGLVRRKGAKEGLKILQIEKVVDTDLKGDQEDENEQCCTQYGLLSTIWVCIEAGLTFIGNNYPVVDHSLHDIFKDYLDPNE
jgi:hypothetical protein